MKFKFAHLWIFIGSFMLFIVFLVVGAVSQKIDLESDNYYQEEVAYQDVINKKQNYHNLTDTVIVIVDSTGFIADFPPSFLPSLVSGRVSFLCNADKNADFTEKLRLSETGKYLVSNNKFTRRGIYKVKLDWVYQGKPYFLERQIRID